MCIVSYFFIFKIVPRYPCKLRVNAIQTDCSIYEGIWCRSTKIGAQSVGAQKVGAQSMGRKVLGRKVWGRKVLGRKVWRRKVWGAKYGGAKCGAQSVGAQSAGRKILGAQSVGAQSVGAQSRYNRSNTIILLTVRICYYNLLRHYNYNSSRTVITLQLVLFIRAVKAFGTNQIV